MYAPKQVDISSKRASSDRSEPTFKSSKAIQKIDMGSSIKTPVRT